MMDALARSCLEVSEEFAASRSALAEAKVEIDRVLRPLVTNMETARAARWREYELRNALRDLGGLIDHWGADCECNLPPTRSSLDRARQIIRVALATGDAPALQAAE